MSLLETPIMASPNSLKRTYAAAELETPLPSQHYNDHLPIEKFCDTGIRMISTHSDADLVQGISGTGEALSGARNTSNPVVREGSVPPTNTSPPVTASPLKRKKLNATEREVQRIEKQFKEQQKVEEKARKEAEKRARDEEKRIKEEAIKEERKKREDEKEEKRKIKEAEKKAKEDEKAKKERSQLRLNSFFVKPTPSRDSVSSSPAQKGGSSSRRSSIASVDGLSSTARSRSASVSPEVCKTEYDRRFPPFFIQSHTQLAPLNRFMSEPEQPDISMIIIDDALIKYKVTQSSSDNVVEKSDEFIELLRQPPFKRQKRTGKFISVKSVIAALHGTAINPIDLTGSSSAIVKQNPQDLLQLVRVKYLRYAEDVRPPYVGTYTKQPQTCSVSRLCKKPFTRALPATNYDYDSEAEWEELGEGEDLDSEGEEESGDEEGGDDLKEFLDDDEAGDGGKAKRRHVMGDVQPISTGLCWEDSSGDSRNLIVPYGQSSLDLRPFRLDSLLTQPQLSIDPYSTVYWPAPELPKPPITRTDTSNMAPPSRVPLNNLSTSNTLLPINSLPTDTSKPSQPKSATTTTTRAAKPPSKPLPPEVLEEFKQAVQGNELTKAGLIEVLKKQFPKASKDTIKDTLGQIAERVGSKEADKRWVLK